jgi:formylglycine-generating enzyme required for sulfatase activity
MKKIVICILGMVFITLACILPQPGSVPVKADTPTAAASHTPAPATQSLNLSSTPSAEAKALPTQTLTLNPSPTNTTAATAVPTVEFTATITATPGIGSTRISETDGMKLVYVPAGEFGMGSSEAQYFAAVRLCLNAGGKIDYCSQWEMLEKPLHTVYLDAFWMDQTEVTNAMYARCVSAGACQPPALPNSINHKQYYGEDQFADYPVIWVDWNQADAYCKWAGRQLPSEAQWEKAARGTDGRTYPWGEGIDCQKANYNACVGDTARVGSYPAGASPYGALDMAGNVLEWVADWYSASYYSISPKRNPTGPPSGDTKLLRGGSWDVDIYGNARSAYRTYTEPSTHLSDIGFRCAISAVP